MSAAAVARWRRTLHEIFRRMHAVGGTYQPRKASVDDSWNFPEVSWRTPDIVEHANMRPE
jgi:hypothetical protein